MSHMVLPDEVTIRVIVWDHGVVTRYASDPIAIMIRTFARQKADYHLGPFFTDRDGVVKITRGQMLAAVSNVLSYGLMDYVGIEDSFSLVEIAHLSREELQNLNEHYARTWISEDDDIKELYASLKELRRLLGAAANERFVPAWASGRRRDEWDRSAPSREYEYVVSYEPAFTPPRPS